MATQPRQILAHSDYLITRNCLGGGALLKNDPVSKQIFLYGMAMAAKKAGVHITFATTFGTGYACGVRDPNAAFPQFLEVFHGILARAMNRHLGRRGYFWEAGRVKVTRLETPEMALQAMAEALLQPLRLGLAEDLSHYGGVSSWDAQRCGEALRVGRPLVFFRRKGSQLPDEIALNFVRPYGLEDTPQGCYKEMLDNAITAATPRKSTKIHPLPSPEALTSLRRFRRTYHESLEKFRTGLRDTLFPLGTYLLRVRKWIQGIADPPLGVVCTLNS